MTLEDIRRHDRMQQNECSEMKHPHEMKINKKHQNYIFFFKLPNEWTSIFLIWVSNEVCNRTGCSVDVNLSETRI